MALIRGAFGGGQIKGSYSGVTFQQGPFGTVMRNRTVPVNPNTPNQVLAKSAMSLSQAAWVALSDAQRTAWTVYAQGTSWLNKFGDPVNLTGRQMFIRQYSFSTQFAITPVSDAPTIMGVPDASVYVELMQATAADGFNLTSWLSGAGDSAVFYAFGPINNTRNFFKGPYAYRQMIASTDTFPLTDITGLTLVAGQKFGIAARLIDSLGRVSLLAQNTITAS